LDVDDKPLYKSNEKSKHVILNGLVDSEFVKLMQYKSAHEAWNKIKNYYEGDTKVKESMI